MRKRTKLPKINKTTADPVLLQILQDLVNDRRTKRLLLVVFPIITLAALGLLVLPLGSTAWWLGAGIMLLVALVLLELLVALAPKNDRKLYFWIANGLLGFAIVMFLALQGLLSLVSTG